ncbi:MULTISPECIES: FecCD family ABC transporter permease [unclassified Streptomyces]|jgi:iron complex transport system permease protein|uniref:FecCD family ABC transporter permease n=1 Tax=unclassified Streptomyces TaxID=2593676 RepID=UPI00081BBD83|nr:MULTISPECIES: iron chelate uptake ABC transporter family permease subunit [unclassified Streptomyces]MYQ87101.1 iron chelate uptake ABC transporter family permease subunit [Streptomyces sp. SID4936]SCE41062.1 iron complex transport system permease protein [Streptomyces sp. DvalAA-43]
MTSRQTAIRTASPRGFLRVGRSVALPVRRVSVLTALVLFVLLLAGAVATLSLGRLGIPLSELAGAVTGGAEGKNGFVIERLRGPRLVVAVGTGAALGLSGALFQSVTRNPLGSPDVIGLASGAGAGAAISALLFPDTVPVALGALIGAVLAMVLVYVSTGTGFRNPARLVIAGIGIAAMGTAITQYVVYAMERDRAAVLTAYVNGSLSARSWEDATTIWLVLLVVAPLTVLLSRRLDIGEMGDDIAAALGSQPRRTKTAAVVLAIVLSAGAVSVAGPIAFIALTSPQVAKRITRVPGPHLALSALTGALLLVLADLCAQQLPLFDNLPVGIYTMAIGGVYLGCLLVREWRRGVL